MTEAPTTRETADHAEGSPSIAEVVEGEVRPHVSADHAELLRLAEAASEGPWSLKEGATSYPESDDADSWSAVLTPRGHEVVTLYERYGIKGEDRSDYDDDARFIAAANPATVLSLLSEIAALRGEAASLEIRRDFFKHNMTQAERQRDELRKALEPFANLGVTSGPDDEPCHYAYRITRGAIRNARQVLANQGADQ